LQMETSSPATQITHYAVLCLVGKNAIVGPLGSPQSPEIRRFCGLRESAALHFSTPHPRSLGGRRKVGQKWTFSGVPAPLPTSKYCNLSGSERLKNFLEISNPSAAQTPSGVS
jgi:hypothetical protein